jgi:hydrogenase nickel incorporation protein HypB
MFHKADLVLITKIDLLPALPDVKVETILENLRAVMPRFEVLQVSARTGRGIAQWVDWLRAHQQRPRTLSATGAEA